MSARHSSRSGSCLWVISVLLLAASTAAEYLPDLHLSGACSAKSYLNDLVFRFQGRTATGAPWYKATTATRYIYWDKDCGGGGDGEPRWIIDSDAPSTTLMRDLDGDGQCNYDARIDTSEKDLPPTDGFWTMQCGSITTTRYLVLADITTTVTTTTKTFTTTTVTTTSTKTSTTKTETSTSTTTVTTTTTTRTQTTTSTKTTTTKTSTTTSTVTTTTTMMQLKLSGTCLYKDFLNGLTFIEQGKSAIGARYFKAAEAEQYLYYDVDCNGGDDGKARWIIDDSMPNPDLQTDLDEDEACNYHARLDWDDPLHIPLIGTWKVWCGLSWDETTLTFDHDWNYTVAVDWDRYSAMVVAGSFSNCSEQDALQGQQFDYMGETHDGSPYYKSSDNNYLYFDQHCSGATESSARWIVDSDPPDLDATSDLDGDGGCYYRGRVKTEENSFPPSQAMWRMQCGEDWKDVWMTLTRLQSTTTTTIADPHGSGETTTTKKSANSAAGNGPLNLAITIVVAACIWLH